VSKKIHIPFKYLIPVFYFLAIFLMVVYQWNTQIQIHNGSGSLIYRSLMENSAYIKKGFNPDEIFTIPAVTDSSEWVNLESSPFTVTNSSLPDLPNRRYLSPFGKPAEEFTIIIPVEMDDKGMEMLQGDSSVIPGIYISIIGENWEIFLNGNLIRSEMYLDENGQILSNRTWRDVHFPLDKNHFVLGTNVFAFRIVGDPSYSVTGLYYADPYYIDDYRIIKKQHQNSLRFFVSGVLGYTGIYYLLIFLSIRSKKELYNLYYSIFSLMLCVHFITTEGAVYNLIPNSDVAARLEYLSFFLAMTVLLVFIEQMGRQKVSKISWGFLIFSVYIGITQIFFCNQYADEIMHLYLVLILLYFSFVFFGVVYDVFIKRKYITDERAQSSFLSILVGSLVVYACGIHDALDVIVFRNAFRLFLYSTFVFHVGMAFTMSRRFSRVYKELEQSNVILEKTVHDRTMELEKQTTIAIQASQAKSQFLATMSHEIRTPLNAVIGLSEIELQGNLSRKSKNNIGQIYQSGSSLLGIINDVLDISKIEAGSFNLIPVEYDTAALINDTVNLNRVRIGTKPITFVLEIEKGFPKKLFGDERRIKQILNNILSNAIKYTKEGSVTLTIKCEHSLQNKALLQLIVRDTGMGIRGDEIEKLFDDYLQLDATANRKIEGTGLGLAITKKLSEMMGGSITVDSEYGKGSIFTIRLLQTFVNNDVLGEETAQELRNFQYSIAGKERLAERSWMPYGKVLVVDDMPVNLHVAKGLLEPYGLRIYTADSGKEAVEMIMSGEKYDLIFMDHMMPEMDGVETVKEIRAWEAGQYTNRNLRKQIPIVALTANALVGSSELFLSNGFNGFISKPVDIVQLNETLNKWVRDKQSKNTLKKAEEEKKARKVMDSSEQLEEQIPEMEIPGINLEHGIAATGGTFEGYLRVLSAFSRDAHERLPMLGNEKDMNGFVTNVHALKSALLAMGANELSSQAAMLEAAGKSGQEDVINENLAVFTEQLSYLLKNIQIFLEMKTKTETEKTDDFHSLFVELADMLKTRKALSEIDLFIEELGKKPLDSDTRVLLEKISDEVMMTEYDNALKIAEKLL